MRVNGLPLLLLQVCLFFDGKLLRGNRSTKLSSSDLAAFDSPNFPPLAELSVNLSGP